jgi:hypothetical protein
MEALHTLPVRRLLRHCAGVVERNRHKISNRRFSGMAQADGIERA